MTKEEIINALSTAIDTLYDMEASASNFSNVGRCNEARHKLEEVLKHLQVVDGVIYWCENNDKTIETEGDELSDDFRAGAEYQRKIDADLGSPAYVRGYVHGKEHEEKKYRETLDLCKEWFEDIAEKCSRLTSGNVSHMGATIRGFANNCSEYIQIATP